KIASLATALALGSVLTATAAPITVDANDVNDDFDVVFDGSMDGAPQAGLTALAEFDFLGTQNVNGHTVFTFDVILTNTSSAPITNSRVSGIGWDSTPDLVESESSVSNPWVLTFGADG